MVKDAAIPAVSASISTPVRSSAGTRASRRTTPAVSSQATSTSAPASATGWHKGRRSGVRWAAITPASRAAASASPFSSRPSLSSLRVSREQRRSARAIATREVRSFSPTSIIFIAKSQSSVPQLLVVFAVEVADLVHQRVAHLAVQFLFGVRRAREVAPVEEDGGPRFLRRRLRRRPEEAEDAGREGRVGGDQIAHLGQILDCEVGVCEAPLDVGRALLHLFRHDAPEDRGRRRRAALEAGG